MPLEIDFYVVFTAEVNIMSDQRQSIECLNHLLKNQFTLINQGILHARIFSHWGLIDLEQMEKEQYLEEMQQSNQIIERILTLGGLPNLQNSKKMHIGSSVEEILLSDVSLKKNSLCFLPSSIQHLESVYDNISREIFVRILEKIEEHVAVLEGKIKATEPFHKHN